MASKSLKTLLERLRQRAHASALGKLALHIFSPGRLLERDSKARYSASQTTQSDDEGPAAGRLHANAPLSSDGSYAFRDRRARGL